MKIRPAKSHEIEQILAIHLDAFGAEEGPEIVELLELMLQDKTAEPLFSFVAEEDGELLAHVLFSAVQVSATVQVKAQILAPLAVRSDRQRQGVGKALVEFALASLKQQGFDLVFVLGHPEYYPVFGFQPAGALGFVAPHPIAAKNAAAWMVVGLNPSALQHRGNVICSEVLGRPHYWQE